MLLAFVVQFVGQMKKQPEKKLFLLAYEWLLLQFPKYLINKKTKQKLTVKSQLQAIKKCQKKANRKCTTRQAGRNGQACGIQLASHCFSTCGWLV